MGAVVLAAACGSKEMDVFDEKGKPMDESEAASIKAEAEAEAEDLAPDFQMALFPTDLHNAGETLRLSDLRGNPVVVNFWFPSCGPCRAEMPDLERVFQKHRSDGVEFVGVQLLGLDTVEDGQAFIDETGVNFAIGADPDGGIVIDYNIRGFPTTVFIDENGSFVRKWTGPLNEEKLEEFVQELLE